MKRPSAAYLWAAPSGSRPCEAGTLEDFGGVRIVGTRVHQIAISGPGKFTFLERPSVAKESETSAADLRRPTRSQQPHEICDDLGCRLAAVYVADAHAGVHSHVAGVAIDAAVRRYRRLPPGPFG